MAGKHTLTFTDENFATEVLNSSEPVLVDFWAEWCGPCKLLGPTIDDLATDFAGRIKVGKFNVDDGPDTAAKYRISGIPTVMLFKAGQQVKTFVGVRPKAEFAAALNELA